MGNNIKNYIETDEIGTHKVIEYQNGRKIRTLKEPSKWYKEKQAKRADEQRIANEVRRAKHEKEKLIKDKMRELAIKELEKEGKL